VIVSVDFLIKNPLSGFDVADILSDTGSDESVLEPSIGSFDFTFGLRGKGIGNFNVTVLEDLFPLGISLIGQQMVFSPEGIPSLDEPKNGMGIDVIGVRESVAKDHGLQGEDMRPAGFFFDQGGVEDETAVVIERSDQIPFLPGSRGPEMIRRVMLDQFSGIVG